MQRSILEGVAAILLGEAGDLQHMALAANEAGYYILYSPLEPFTIMLRTI